MVPSKGMLGYGAGTHLNAFFVCINKFKHLFPCLLTMKVILDYTDLPPQQPSQSLFTEATIPATPPAGNTGWCSGRVETCMVASIFFLKIYLIFSLMHLYVSVCMHMCIWLHKEARRGYQILWFESYRWLSVAQ